VEPGDVGGLAVLIDGSTALDVVAASSERFGPHLSDVYDRWQEFASWAADVEVTGGQSFGPADLGRPSPTPRQVFGIGLNYRSHAEETGLQAPEIPAVFTKFPTCLAGPDPTVELPAATVDRGVELVAVIGRRADRVPEERG